ncbi:MAG: succinylglutamate desuccinylase/aspartoacylase family protein [Paludibacteraceae bacterium]|nr:succinylglutamate desuccinylase/aspartoacylase family protein [Paludibacteraceae bacterium]
MRIETIFEMTSPCRDNFRIQGYRFGEGEKTLAIVGAMRGDEVQQQYICSQLVNRLTMMEQRGEIVKGKSILVIPSCNPFSMNVSRRFWAMDNTDINRMFPGYDQGETTQRIAAAVFSAINGFEYGIQMASYYVPGDFVPHVRMLKTGYEDVETARLFGMKYVTICQPRPFDTALLNYNWQLWDTKAFSVYAGKTDRIDRNTGNETLDAIFRMMKRTGIIHQGSLGVAYDSILIDEADLLHIKAHHAGIFCRLVDAGSRVAAGESLAHIIDPYNGQVLSDVKSTAEGTVFFAHHRPVVFQNALLFMIHVA